MNVFISLYRLCSFCREVWNAPKKTPATSEFNTYRISNNMGRAQMIVILSPILFFSKKLNLLGIGKVSW